MAKELSKRNKIREYFVAPKPKFPVKPFIIGIILIILSIYLLSSTDLGGIVSVGILIGLLVAGIPFLLFLKKKKRYDARPSGAQMDNWLADDFKNIIESFAIDRLGIDKSSLVSESLVIPGPIFWEDVNGIKKSEILRRIGSDACFRYSAWDIQIFVFTEDYLGNYGCDYNWLRDSCLNERTGEFFYKDVVSVKTFSKSSNYVLGDKEKVVESQMFQLKLSGDDVSVITNDSELKVSSAMTSRADKAVQSIRAMLRQKKS